MKTLFRKLYIYTLVELIVLILYLLWKPSEDASQFFLGRSILRWAITFPLLLIFIAGAALYFLHIGKENFTFDMNGNSYQTLWEYRGIILTLLNSVFVFFFVLWGWIAYEKRVLGWFFYTLPWLFFGGLLIWQFSYWILMSSRSTGEDIDFKKSFSDLPTILNRLLFEIKKDAFHVGGFNEEKIYWIPVSILIAVFLFVGYFFIKYAGLNSDEGWYLYAARQVYVGQRPYQDFGFTQMPLLPYVYGIGLTIAPSIYTGRLTSLIILSLSLYVMFLISKKYFIREAFIWLLFLVITNSESFYFNTIVKTYSLTLLFFLLSLYLLASTLRVEIKYPLVFLVLLLGFFTRITFAFFAIFLVIKVIMEILKLENRLKVFSTVIVVNVPVILVGLSFLYPIPQNFIWSIYTYNAGLHGFEFSVNTIFEYFAHLRGYFRSVKVFWPIGIPLIFSVISGIYYGRFRQEKVKLLLAAAIAIFLFLSIHFSGGGPMYEYYIPATTFLMALIIWFLFSFSEIKSGINYFVLWTSRFSLFAITVTLIYTGSFGSYNYEYYHGNPPIETVKKLAEVVNEYYPEQPIFTLEALYVAIEARREIPTGMSMAQFSILDMPTADARKLHFVNYGMMEDILRSKDMNVLILNEREVESLNAIIKDDYTNVFEVDDFGQKSIKAYVFIRNK